MSDHPFKEMMYSSFPEFLAPSVLTYRASKMTTHKSPHFSELLRISSFFLFPKDASPSTSGFLNTLSFFL